MNKTDELRIDPDEIRNLLFENADKGYIHPTHKEDMLRYHYLKQGDMRAVEEAYRTMDDSMQGKLSMDPLRNAKYLFVVSTALASRFVVEAGVPLETAYAISDLYIQRADVQESVGEVRNLLKGLYRTYVDEVNKVKKKNALSKSVVLCLNYIDSHFNEKITVDELAAYVEEKISERAQAKKEKDFARADAIRDELAAKGIIIKDTREGVTWSRA